MASQMQTNTHRVRFARSLACALLAVLWLAPDAKAFASAQSDPISIDACYIPRNRGYTGFPSLALTFTNQRPVAADEVRFTIVYANKTAHVTDVGTFSQHIGIHHYFNSFENLLWNGFLPQSCTVDYVHFSDGTVWTPTVSPAKTPVRPSQKQRLGAEIARKVLI